MARVLIVDYDESTRGALASVVRTYGHDVHEAASGGGALDVIESKPGISTVLLAHGAGAIADALVRALSGHPRFQKIRVVAIGDGGADEVRTLLGTTRG